MYLPSFPLVTRDLGASSSQVQLTLTAFMVGMAAGQLLWGPASDRFGRRRPLLWAVVLFMVSSALAPLSPTVWALVAARAVQGFTGSAGVVIGRAVARDLASGPALARVFSLLGVIGGLAPVVAPVVGGLLVGPAGWRGILWCITVLGAAMLLAVLVAVRETLPVGARSPSGLGHVKSHIAQVAGDRRFLGFAAAQAFSFGAVFAFISASSFVLQVQYGLSSTTYSLVFAANSLMIIVGGIANARLVGRVAPARLLRIALLAATGGNLALFGATLAWGQPPLAVFQGLVMIVSLMGPPIMANTTALGLARHGGSTAGMASAVMGAIQSAGAGLISPLVSVGGDPTAGSLALVMVSSSVLATGSYWLLTRSAPA
jgi:DHA1 family bicyclomycin/chloramphenicol resistance-like MFS transporter